MGTTWEKVRASAREKEQAEAEEIDKEKAILDQLGLTLEKYQDEVEREYERLKSEGLSDSEDLLKEAFRIVEERHK